MKVSVIVLTYNQERYIEATIQSIINQKRDFGLEIIIGDDCSTDKTIDIINSFEKLYPSIIRVNRQEENRGVVNNYISSALLCTGEYICGCGGDDTWDEEKLKKQVDYLESHPDTILNHTAANIIDENGKIVGQSCENFTDLLSNNYIYASSVCYRRELLDVYIKDVEPLDKDWRMEDYPMWLYAESNYKISFLNERLINYRKIKSSITHWTMSACTSLLSVK